MTEELSSNEILKIPSTPDPVEFLQKKFFQSETYLKGKDKYGQKIPGLNEYLERMSSSSLAENKKRMIFNERDDAKFLLMDFAQNELRLVYDPKNYSEEANTLFDAYQDSVLKIMKIKGDDGLPEENQPKLIWADMERDLQHNELAYKLSKEMNEKGKFEGLVTKRVGRVLSRLLLIDQDLDTFEKMSADERLRHENILRNMS